MSSESEFAVLRDKWRNVFWANEYVDEDVDEDDDEDDDEDVDEDVDENLEKGSAGR